MKYFHSSRTLCLVIFVAVANLLPCLGDRRSRYFMNDNEAGRTVETGNYIGRPEYHDCFIIVQEEKRIGGQCVKIRDKINGCVAGNLMQPLHQDCL